ncbi:S-phase kinase-associated protein 1-like [Galendromus occidentalis]|uniref:S-phase kinase-associated protein 1-like n=1 Tax=Galendromus occidentalis TaxID=34638 RepID=A0AAJ6VZL3_9ACAR|nr:S-phase kinase-associated protein 1-like [Galendromus occidentalis]
MDDIILESNDQVSFKVCLPIVRKMKALQVLFGDDALTDRQDRSIPLPKVNSECLRMILVWADHHVDDEAHLSASQRQDLLEWESYFFSVSSSQLFELVSAADYLGLVDLVEAGCKVIAKLIRDKSTDQLRFILGIRDPGTR